jgi:hypothetical protein
MEQSRADQSRQSLPARIAAATLILLALFLIPAPLLPPHRLAEAVQSTLGVQWKAAYLFAALGLQVAIYGMLGLLAAFAIARAETIRQRLLHSVLVPVFTVAAAILIRSLALGFVPIWINAVVPILACVAGTWFGPILRSKRPWVAVVLLVLMAGGTLWTLLGPSSEESTRHTEGRFRHLVAAGPYLPQGEEKMMAAILALGLGVGDPRLARFVGLDPQIADLPENLTVEQFRLKYEGVGSPKYRQAVRDLEARLDRCALLAPVVPE